MSKRKKKQSATKEGKLMFEEIVARIDAQGLVMYEPVLGDYPFEVLVVNATKSTYVFEQDWQDLVFVDKGFTREEVTGISFGHGYVDEAYRYANEETKARVNDIVLRAINRMGGK